MTGFTIAVAPQRHRLEGLDLLRLLAAGAVWLFHLGMFDYGYLGVEVFFMISGFVIAVTARGRGPIGFTFARVARLWPAFLVCLALTLAVIPAGRFTPEAIAANITMVPALFGQPAIEGAYWSLMVEIIFYGFVALLICQRGAFPAKIAVAAAVWLGLCALNLASPVPLLKVALALEWGSFFCVGIATWLVFAGEPRAKPLWLAAVVIAVWSAAVQTRFDPAVAGAVVLASALALPAIVRSPLSIPFAAQAGALSYPVYLLHHEFGEAIAERIGSTALAAVAVVAVAWLITLVEPVGKRAIVSLGRRFEQRLGALLPATWPSPRTG